MQPLSICYIQKGRKAEMAKQMKSHDRWVQDPELRCRYCLQVLHNKDGLHQYLKTCRHNPERPQQQYMCRNPGYGSVFSLLKKRNYHEFHRCHPTKGGAEASPNKLLFLTVFLILVVAVPDRGYQSLTWEILVLQRGYRSSTEENHYIIVSPV